MPRKRYARRKHSKMKLQQGAIYTLFSLGLITSAGLQLFSFVNSGGIFTTIHDMLVTYFGITAILFPFVFLFLGLFLSKMKFYFAQLHICLGYLFFFFSLVGLLHAGSIGQDFLFQPLADMLGAFGADIVYVAGLFVGIVIFFDTSLDEILEGIILIVQNIGRFFPTKIFSFSNNRKMVIKNNPLGAAAQKVEPAFRGAEKNVPPPIINAKKETPLISDMLITNPLGNSGIWEYPSLNLLSDTSAQKAERGDIKKIASLIERTLQSFGIEARVAEVNLGPSVTQYALELALGTKVSKITSLTNDLALATEAPTGQIRIEAPIPGRNLVGIEIPNRSLEVVSLKGMLSSANMQKSKSKLSVVLGLDVAGNPVVANIAKMPHVLIAGTTGSGKSVSLNAFIMSMLFRASPNEVKFIMIDPKRVELTGYNGIPHLLTPVIVEADKILSSLKWAMNEMDRRYKIFAERGVRNIDSYNELSGFQALPYIVIFIDELADLMQFAPVEVEDAIARLAQMARATGIHLVIATQRPSVDVITGLIKSNIPCRIAFNVSSMIDSRVILDSPGAEKLLGRGDMLYIPPEQAKPSRIQGAFVSEKEVKKLVDYLKEKNPVVNYTQEVIEQPIALKKNGGMSGAEAKDPLFEESIRILCQYDRASASLLQRKLSVGYSRAARILDQLEAVGVVGHAEGSKPRDVLIKNPDDIINKLHET